MTEEKIRWALRLEKCDDADTIEKLKMYSLCKKLRKLPSEIQKEDAYWIEVFEIILDQEAREMKKEQDMMRAKSLAAMKK